MVSGLADSLTRLLPKPDFRCRHRPLDERRLELCTVFSADNKSDAIARRRPPIPQLLMVWLQRLVSMKVLPIGGDPIGGNVFLRGD